MKCPSCGAEVEEVGIYCPKCGERMEKGEDSMPPVVEREPQPEAVSEPAPGAEASAGADAAPPRRPAEAIRDSVDARRDVADDAEEELWQGRYAKRTMIGAWLLCGLITVVLVIAGVMLGGGRMIVWIVLAAAVVVIWGYPLMLLTYRRLSIRYRLTSQRFFHEKGVLRHITDRIEVIDFDDIAYDQTILQRMVNVGTIHITSSDRSHPVLHVCGVENVKEVASLMDGARRKERIRRGLHIEAV